MAVRPEDLFAETDAMFDTPAKRYVAAAELMAHRSLVAHLLLDLIENDAAAWFTMKQLQRRVIERLQEKPIELTRAATEHVEEIIEPFLERARRRTQGMDGSAI